MRARERNAMIFRAESLARSICFTRDANFFELYGIRNSIVIVVVLDPTISDLIVAKIILVIVAVKSKLNKN